MTTHTTPAVKPANPCFSSGPTAKYPTFKIESLSSAQLGRSHRSAPAKAKLKAAIDRTKALLELPEDYRVAIVPASDTGAVEMAMWSMLGARPVDMLAWESFGQDWVTDVQKQLQLEDTQILTADYGQLPEFDKVRDDADIVFTWNGTTSGVRVPNTDWINPNPDRVVICDATSAVFAQKLDWEKLDVVTFSWQKVLGGEAAHGMLILSPNAVRRLESYTPPRPLPKIFRMTSGGKLNEALFEGAVINTPSMLCVEDYLLALDWVESIGGYEGLCNRADYNLSVINAWVEKTSWVEFLCADDESRSNSGVTLKITDPRVSQLDPQDQQAFIKGMVKALDTEGAAYDIGGYKKAPPGLRIWCGATVDSEDLQKLTPWLDWAFDRAASVLDV